MIDHETALSISTRLGKIEGLVEGLHMQLLGNGQPGLINKIETHLEYSDKRVDSLEQTRSHVKGALAIMGAILSWIGWEQIKRVFHLS